MLLDFIKVNSFPRIPAIEVSQMDQYVRVPLCLIFVIEVLRSHCFLFYRTFIMSDIARNDEWNSDRPQEERKYDGPAGMDPDGVIDSNWDEVRRKSGHILVKKST